MCLRTRKRARVAGRREAEGRRWGREAGEGPGGHGQCCTWTQEVGGIGSAALGRLLGGVEAT